MDFVIFVLVFCILYKVCKVRKMISYLNIQGESDRSELFMNCVFMEQLYYKEVSDFK